MSKEIWHAPRARKDVTSWSASARHGRNAVRRNSAKTIAEQKKMKRYSLVHNLIFQKPKHLLHSVSKNLFLQTAAPAAASVSEEKDSWTLTMINVLVFGKFGFVLGGYRLSQKLIENATSNGVSLIPATTGVSSIYIEFHVAMNFVKLAKNV